MTTPGSLRRLVVATTIGSFSIAALLGVLALLGGGDFGDAQANVLLTTVVVGLASIATLCYLATAETGHQTVGVAGGFVVLVPLLTGLWLIWGDDGSTGDGVWRAFGVGVVAAATLAQASLLLALGGTDRRLRPLLTTTLVLAAILALIVSSLILGTEDSDGLFRILGIVAILDVLGTVVVIALAVAGRISGASGTAAPTGPTGPTGPDTGSRTVMLPGDVLDMLDERVRLTGRTRDDLVAEAVATYLGTGRTETQSGT